MDCCQSQNSEHDIPTTQCGKKWFQHANNANPLNLCTYSRSTQIHVGTHLKLQHLVVWTAWNARMFMFFLSQVSHDCNFCHWWVSAWCRSCACPRCNGFMAPVVLSRVGKVEQFWSLLPEGNEVHHGTTLHYIQYHPIIMNPSCWV